MLNVKILFFDYEKRNFFVRIRFNINEDLEKITGFFFLNQTNKKACKIIFP